MDFPNGKIQAQPWGGQHSGKTGELRFLGPSSASRGHAPLAALAGREQKRRRKNPVAARSEGTLPPEPSRDLSRPCPRRQPGRGSGHPARAPAPAPFHPEQVRSHRAGPAPVPERRRSRSSSSRLRTRGRRPRQGEQPGREHPSPARLGNLRASLQAVGAERSSAESAVRCQGIPLGPEQRDAAVQPRAQHRRKTHDRLSLKDKEPSRSGTPREVPKDAPLTPLYLFAFYNVLGHRHFNLQVAVVLGPGVILSHSSVVAVGVCLELLLSPGGGRKGRHAKCGTDQSPERAGKLRAAYMKQKGRAEPLPGHPASIPNASGWCPVSPPLLAGSGFRSAAPGRSGTPATLPAAGDWQTPLLAVPHRRSGC